jgi:hypothetical protein
MGQWWITDGPLPEGRKILGPYRSQDDAMRSRKYLEKVTKPATYWVDSDGIIPGNIGRICDQDHA